MKSTRPPGATDAGTVAIKATADGPTTTQPAGVSGDAGIVSQDVPGGKVEAAAGGRHRGMKKERDLEQESGSC
jgi:hypothetical protein